MGLKHLQGAVWAVWLASAVGTLAQENPPDSDGDTVPDHTDVCPQTAGSPDNSGCPAGEELVFAYGTSLDDIDSVTCPDGNTQMYWDLCPTFGTWGQFAIALYDDDHFRNHVGTWWGDDGYRPPPEEEDEGTVEVTTGDGTNFTCLGVATGVTVLGGTLVASGFIVAYFSIDPGDVEPNWINRPVYDQSGFLYDDVYFNPEPPSVNPVGMAVSVGLGLAGSLFVVVGAVIYAGCYIADVAS